MKRLSLLSALILMLILAGCQTAPDTAAPETTAAQAITEAPAESGEREEPKWTKFIQYMVDEYLHHVPADANIVEAHVLLDRITGGDEMTVLDLREAGAFEAGHLKGAINAPWGTAFKDALTRIPMDKPVYLYCATGQFSGQGNLMLRLLGYESYAVNLGWNYMVSGQVADTSAIGPETGALLGSENVLDEDILEELTLYLESVEELKTHEDKNYVVPIDTFKEWRSAGNTMTILSVQDHEAYEKGKIPGALNLPYDSHFAHDLSELTLEPTIVIYDEEGQKGSQAMAALRLLGYNAYLLDGGLKGWTDGGNALE